VVAGRLSKIQQHRRWRQVLVGCWTWTWGGVGIADAVVAVLVRDVKGGWGIVLLRPGELDELTGGQ
jgi:hypothetical protein